MNTMLFTLILVSLLGATVTQSAAEEASNATTAAPAATEAPATKAKEEVTTVAPATKAKEEVTTVAPATKAKEEVTTAAPATKAKEEVTTAAPATKAKEEVTTEAAMVKEHYGLTVTCTSEYMEARLDTTKHTTIRVDTVALEDRNCRVTKTEGDFLYFRTSLDGCRTTHNTSDKYIMYYNSIYADTGTGTNSAKISRALQAEFPFKCTYPRSAILSVVSFSPRRKVVYTRASDFGNFTFMMDLYETGKFEKKHEKYPVEVNLNELLNVEVGVHSNDSKLAIFAEECWATPSSDSEDKNKYKIIADGCKKDDTVVYKFKPDEPHQRFQVRAFRFISGRTNDVYLHCRVEVCREGDEDSNCAKGCRAGSRRRRSLASDSSSETLTIGMISLTENANAQSATGNASSFTNISIVAGVLGVLVVGLVAILVVVYKKRRATPANVVFKVVSGNEADQLMA